MSVTRNATHAIMSVKWTFTECHTCKRVSKVAFTKCHTCKHASSGLLVGRSDQFHEDELASDSEDEVSANPKINLVLVCWMARESQAKRNA